VLKEQWHDLHQPGKDHDHNTGHDQPANVSFQRQVGEKPLSIVISHV
jgi:hypothetical protein